MAPELVEAKDGRPFPTFGAALVLLLIQLLVGFFLQMLPVSGRVLDFPIQVISFVIVLWIAQSWSHQPWGDLLGIRRVQVQVWFPLVVGLLGLVVIVSGIDGLFNYFWPEPAWFRNLWTQAGWLPVVLGAPVGEELLSRGVILGGFLKRYAPVKGVLLSALLFSLSHLFPWQLVSTFLFGVYAGWVFYLTRSIWPVISLHMLYNGVVYLGAHYKVPYIGDNRLLPWWMWFVGAVILGTGLVSLNVCLRQRKGDCVPGF